MAKEAIVPSEQLQTPIVPGLAATEAVKLFSKKSSEILMDKYSDKDGKFFLAIYQMTNGEIFIEYLGLEGKTERMLIVPYAGVLTREKILDFLRSKKDYIGPKDF